MLLTWPISGNTNKFYSDIHTALMAVNIDNLRFKVLFLEVLQQIHSISTLHNCYLVSAYYDLIAEIMEHICDACIYLSAEETIDAFGRYSSHVTAGAQLLYVQSLRQKCIVKLFLISSTMD